MSLVVKLTVPVKLVAMLFPPSKAERVRLRVVPAVVELGIPLRLKEVGLRFLVNTVGLDVTLLPSISAMVAVKV